MGFSNSTDTAFAEIVLRSLPDENRRNVNLPRGHKITVATGLLQTNACGVLLNYSLCSLSVYVLCLQKV